MSTGQTYTYARTGTTISDAEQRLSTAIQKSTNPDLLKIKDVSSWYRMRSLLGPRRHMAQIVKRAADGKSYSAAIFDVTSSSSTSSSIGKKPLPRIFMRFIGDNYASLVLAHNACEKARVARDNRNNADHDNDSSLTVEPTHLNILIISKSFTGKSHEQRVEFVYQTLLGEYCISPDLLEELQECRIKGVGTVGASVASLPHFQHLGALPFELLLDLRDPSQHTTGSNETLNPSNGSCSREVLVELPNMAQIRAIARETAATSASAHCNRAVGGGTIGHFYHNLTERRLMMDKYQLSCKLVEGNNAILKKGFIDNFVVRSGQETTRRSISSTKAAASAAAAKAESFQMADPKASVLHKHKPNEFGDLESEMTTKYALALHKVTTGALWIQRIYRRSRLPQMQKVWARRHRAALNIQRLLRGRSGRAYATSWRRSRDRSVLVLQRIVRGLCGRRKATKTRHVLTNLAIVTQRYLRGWIARRYLRWMKDHSEMATNMQRVARGFLGRCRYRHILARREKAVQNVAATKLQVMARMVLQMQKYSKMLEEIHHRTVVIPSAVRIQKIWRLALAKLLVQQLQQTRNAATVIQCHVRGTLVRRVFKAMLWVMLQHDCASKIQAITRGYLDRALFAKIRRRNYQLFIIIPSATKIQSCQRGFYERRRQQCAKKIQEVYRRSIAVHEAKKKWMSHVSKTKENMATRIQTCYRASRARSMYMHALDEERSKRLGASHTILRAWRHHKKAENNQRLKEARMHEQSAKILSTLHEEQNKILHLIDAIDFEIEAKSTRIVKAEERIRILKGQLMEATARIGQIEVDIIFAESSDAKYERQRLNAEITFAREETTKCKEMIKTAKEDIRRLQLKQDKLLMYDLDRLYCLEVEEQEKRRRSELQMCLARKEREWGERIRYEKLKWRLKLPAQDKTKAYKPAAAGEEQDDIEYHRTMSAERKRAIAEKRRDRFFALKAMDDQEIMALKRKRGEGNESVHKVYDRITKGIWSMLEEVKIG